MGCYTNKKDIELTQRIIHRDYRISVKSDITHNEVVEHMRKSHLYVAPTFADPFNNTILEAMGCELPIVTTNIRSIPEFVYHNFNGLIIEADLNDREKMVDNLEKSILRLFSNKKLRDEMANESKKIIGDKFTLQVRNTSLKQIYDSALGISDNY